jgi:hypothetical protein
MYVTKRIDPGAPTYSLDYLRKHPDAIHRKRPVACSLGHCSCLRRRTSFAITAKEPD